MSGAQSADDYRFMIRESVGSPAQGDDLANIVTNALPNGAHCYVTENRSLYVFAKFSTIAPFANVIVAPNAGGGRWFLTSTAGAALLAYAFSDAGATNTFPASGTLVPSSTNLFSADVTGLWTFATGGCSLTYNGPTTRAIVRMTGAISPNSANPVSCYYGVSYNGDLTGVAIAGAQGGTRGANFFIQQSAETGDAVTIATERVIDALAAGDTIQPVFGETEDVEVTGNVYSLQLIVEAA